MELSDRAVVAGWLHRTTRNLAAKAVRTEVRRRSREQEAARWHAPEDPMAWDELAPQLDQALDQLEENDRDVLALRFLERRSAREIGAAMMLSEEAAQKRVSRALERLRAIFVERGLAVPTSSLGAAILLNAVQVAPATLGATILSGILWHPHLLLHLRSCCVCGLRWESSDPRNQISRAYRLKTSV